MSKTSGCEYIDLKTLYILLTNKSAVTDFADNPINGIYIADDQGNTLWVSNSCEKLWGYRVDELIGKNVVDLERKGVWNPSGVRKVLESQQRIEVLQETGVGRQLHIVGNPVFDAFGRLSRVVNGVVDLTERADSTEAANLAELEFPSPAMQQVEHLIKKVAPLKTTVLITGESGTGKEVVAKKIHAQYNAQAPFIKIDCSAITASLIESELFGYERGAFSGAERSGKRGLVELAAGGTLFLDEVGEIPLELQGKFLRLLQDKTYVKVGGTKEHKLDARVIAATHRDLEQMVEQKLFRLDLYFRLNVFPIKLPALRERVSDIPVLVDYFCQRFAKQFGYSHRFSSHALACLLSYSWPGNIRELDNVVERMMITTNSYRIESEDLPWQITGQKSQVIEIDEIMLLKDGLRLTEAKLIQLAWKKYGTSTGVAKALGIDQSTASRKIRKYIEPMR